MRPASGTTDVELGAGGGPMTSPAGVEAPFHRGDPLDAA
ncbi:hypothetical protein SCE1572_26910 [Sorangium cellulosum So0157-2]|uniref:Uncharacterized protein n=1 Tax=Sorangium cellulosum So0157-2 TaxID=1254432 RepID=S4XX47_SORCE|nr:hypothetical protein SCE1572_26910 [Sorangium cellulosum So0157-2]